MFSLGLLSVNDYFTWWLNLVVYFLKGNPNMKVIKIKHYRGEKMPGMVLHALTLTANSGQISLKGGNSGKNGTEKEKHV